MKAKDTQWPPLGVQDVKLDQSTRKDVVRFPILKAALKKVLTKI